MSKCSCEDPDGCRGLIFGVCLYVWDVMSTTERKDAREEYSESQQCEVCKLPMCSCVYDNCLKVTKSSKPRGGRPPSTNLSSDRWFVTVSVKPESDIQRLWKRVEKFIGMAKTQYIIAQLDQSGIEEYKHPHVYIYVEYPKALYKSKVLQVYSCAFTDYIGGDNFIDIKLGGDHHIGYCKGIKVDEKQEIVAKAKEYRKENNVLEYIEHGSN